MRLITASLLLRIFQAGRMSLPGGSVKVGQIMSGKRLFSLELPAKVAPFAPTKESRSLILWLSFFHKWRKNGTLPSMMASVLRSSLADQRKKSGGYVAIVASINGKPKFLDERTAVVAPIAPIRKPVEKIAWLLNFPTSPLNCTQLRMVLFVVNH
jgi:hypothetical protein